MTGSVETHLSSVRRAWRATRSEEFWLELRSKDEDIARFSQVITKLNDDSDDKTPFAQLPSRSREGYVALVDNVLGGEQLERWLADLAHRLAAAGFTGALRGATSVSYPDWFYTWDPDDPNRVRTDLEVDRWIRVRPTAFFAWTMDPDRERPVELPDSTWQVLPKDTAAVVDAALRWTRPAGDHAVLRRELFRTALSDEEALRRGLFDAIVEQASAGVCRWSEPDRTAREVVFESTNLSVVQALHDPRPRTFQVSEVRDVLIDLAETSQIAFVRQSGSVLSWISMDQVEPLPNGLVGSEVFFARHLLDRFAADAHGIQVLTTTHLERARNLDGWMITDLGNDRHLVEASDLAPWYDGDSPDVDVLTNARRDFGPMLLTPEAIAAEPVPRPH